MFIIIRFVVAGNGALEQPVIALRVEQTVFVTARLLETVVDICRNDEIILVFYRAFVDLKSFAFMCLRTCSNSEGAATNAANKKNSRS